MHLVMWRWWRQNMLNMKPLKIAARKDFGWLWKWRRGGHWYIGEVDPPPQGVPLITFDWEIRNAIETNTSVVQLKTLVWVQQQGMFTWPNPLKYPESKPSTPLTPTSTPSPCLSTPRGDGLAVLGHGWGVLELKLQEEGGKYTSAIF